MPFNRSATINTGIFMSADDGETWTRILGVYNFDYEGGARNEIDVTALEDEAEVMIPGVQSSTEISMEIWFDPEFEPHKELWSAYRNRVVKRFRVEPPNLDGTQQSQDGTGDEYIEFDAHVVNTTLPFGVNEAVQCSFTLRKTGLDDISWVEEIS